MPSRRTFLYRAGTGLLAVPAVLSACSGSDDGDPVPGGCDGAGAVSSVDNNHTHSVCVTSADLMNPPAAGAQYVTSSDDGHTHAVALSADDLMQLASGGSVTVTSSVVSAHSHAFVLEG